MKRDRRPELMDQPDVQPDAHRCALQSLNRANRLLGVDRALLARVERMVGGRGYSLLDLGAGGGGFLQYVAMRRPPTQQHLLVGLDRSAFAARCARTWQGGPSSWVVADVLAIPLADESFDVVTCSLFLHHFDEPDVVRILREAGRIARKGVVVGDLGRSRLSLGLTWMGTRILSRSELFRVDGPLSVKAAFVKEELTQLAEQAGLHGAEVTRKFPFRLMLTWKKVGVGK